MRNQLILLVLFLTTLGTYAQNKGQLSGSLIAASTRSPIEYASVSLLTADGKKVLDGALTDTKGSFHLKTPPSGKYLVKIEFVGFKTLTVPYTSNGSGAGSLGVLTMSPSATSLEQVTVTAAKPLVETHLDKLVYNAANDLTSQGGVALDVLKKVPSLSVDVDGNVELEGNANVKFFINGKPSTIFGASLADALQSIPASQIKSIEVIASPGAKYDAAGTGGIINIILKDNKVRGINGSVNLSAGTRLENGSVNLNLRRENFGISAFFSGNAQLNTTTQNTTDRRSFNPTMDTITRLYQDGFSTFKRKSYQTGLNIDWDLSPHDKLSAGFTFDHFDNLTNGQTGQSQQVTDGKGALISSLPSVRNSGSKNRSNTADWNFDYKKTFRKKGQELEFLATTSSGNNFADYFQEQAYSNTAINNSGSRGNSPGTDQETNLSIDYRQPINENLTIETGAKSVLEKLSTTVATDTLLPNGAYSPNANQTYSFLYKRQIYAYYVSAEFSIFHHFLEGQAGLRYEYTHTSADLKGAQIPSYGLFFPSVVLTHQLDEQQSIKLAYSHRIERPDYGDLNPFYNISDPHSISTGNPYLRPEKGERYELGYNRKIGNGGNLYVGALYRHNSDDIQALATYYPVLDVNGVTYTDVSLSQRFNIGSQTGLGANIFSSIPITSALSIRSNIMMGSVTNESPGLGKATGFSFRGNLNASYKFDQGLVAEIFGNYNASQKTLQGRRPAFGFYTLAMRKEFLHKKASLGLTATNPFNKFVNQESLLNGANFSQTAVRRVPYQSFGITFSYRFGKLEFKAKDHSSSNEPSQID